MGNKTCDQRPVAVGRYHVRAFTTGMYLAGRLAGGKMIFIVKEGKKQEASGFLPQPLSPGAAGAQPSARGHRVPAQAWGRGCHLPIWRLSW